MPLFDISEFVVNIMWISFNNSDARRAWDVKTIKKASEKKESRKLYGKNKQKKSWKSEKNENLCHENRSTEAPNTECANTFGFYWVICEQ